MDPLPFPRGYTRNTLRPGTLDLADRASLALQGMAGILDAEREYELYPFARFSTDTSWMAHYKNSLDLEPKFLEAMPKLLTMSGSTEVLPVCYGLLERVVRDMGDDGLFYSMASPDRPWHEGGTYHAKQSLGEDYTSLIGNGRLLLALINWWQYDGDVRWKEAAARLAKGLCDIAIQNEDYAYYPDGEGGMAFCYCRESGWGRETREPESDFWGGEGSVLCYYGPVVRGLSRWYALSGDEEALGMARRLATFMRKPKIWAIESQADQDLQEILDNLERDTGESYVPGKNLQEIPNDPYHLVARPEHAHFKGHFHGKLAGIRGLLEYALVTDDRATKLFVREGYEFARNRGIPRMGCFGDHCWIGSTEGCTVADMLELAVELSANGIGDFWDDVEAIATNHLVEQQLTSADALDTLNQAGKDPRNPWGWFLDMLEENVSEIPGGMNTDRVNEKLIGTWVTFSSPTFLPYPYITACCTPNCSLALYSAWESAVSDRDGRLQIHHFLNRVHSAVTVSSYLPREGKVVIELHQERSVAIRIPEWIRTENATLEITDASSVSSGPGPLPSVVGGYALLDPLPAGSVLTLRFALEDEVVTYTMPFIGKQTITFRGNTVVDVFPREQDPHHLPIYQREQDLSKTPAAQEGEVWVSENLIRR